VRVSGRDPEYPLEEIQNILWKRSGISSGRDPEYLL